MCSDMLGHWDGYKDEGAEQYNVNNGVLQETIMQWVIVDLVTVK